MQNSSASSGQYPMLSIRADHRNPNHHLWNNNGTWFLCYTVLTSPVTAERVRTSLKTRSLGAAIRRRDQKFAAHCRNANVA
jgi:hypothetical protein